MCRRQEIQSKKDAYERSRLEDECQGMMYKIDDEERLGRNFLESLPAVLCRSRTQLLCSLRLQLFWSPSEFRQLDNFAGWKKSLRHSGRLYYLLNHIHADLWKMRNALSVKRCSNYTPLVTIMC